MASTITKVKNTNQEETKMMKYIVEAPEPKKGQKTSSGGIRENGKLAAQYKNPVPYKEPTPSPAVVASQMNPQLLIQEQKRTRRNEVSYYLLKLAWQEFGEPLVRTGLNCLADKVISCFDESRNRQSETIQAKDIEIIDVEADEIVIPEDDEKTIRFPSKKVI